jgi:hypothetical protein
MQTRLIEAAFVLLAATSLHPCASAAKLVYVYGTVAEPRGLNENDDVQPVTVVRAGKDAIVAIEETWNASSGKCQRVTVLGNGQSYTVAQPKSGGPCSGKAPELSSAQSGRTTLGERLVESKSDDPGSASPESQARWRDFDRWKASARRSFTGVLTAADASSIRLRSAAGTEMTFSLSSTTIDTPAGLDQMLNRSLRVDYAGSSRTAERITLAETP